MKIARTYPNPFYIGLVLIVGLLMVGYSIFIIHLIFKGAMKEESFFDLDAPSILLILFLLLFNFLFFRFIFSTFYYLVNGWCNASMNRTHLTLIVPLKAQKKSFEWRDLRAYSTSEDWVLTKLGIVLWRCDSIVVYTKNNEAFEFIKLFNFRFSVIETQLKANKVKYLGFEQFSQENYWFIRGFRRQYKFLGDNAPVEE